MKLLQLSKPHLIVMVGIAGSGKSYFAEKFSDTFQAPLVSDVQLAKCLDTMEVSTSHVSTLLKQLVSLQLCQLFKTERTIIVDVDSDTRTDRGLLTTEARKYGYETLFIWVQTDQATAKDRAAKPAKQSTNKQLSSEEHDHRVKRFTPPNANENTVVISGKHTYATQAKVVLKRLASPRTESAKLQPAPERAVPVAPGRRNIMIR